MKYTNETLLAKSWEIVNNFLKQFDSMTDVLDQREYNKLFRQFLEDFRSIKNEHGQQIVTEDQIQIFKDIVLESYRKAQKEALKLRKILSNLTDVCPDVDCFSLN